ncbi:hypothetical protein HF086_011342 [Spodoptera exigua]|uniref:Uncharacterized protein n=1 Tax=Spodoptera exigua TaxID=7107 RepID=A0A922SN84_SPOEX|nr:hypothetical protein HF086_011342 [Spodoptera exigua]
MGSLSWPELVQDMSCMNLRARGASAPPRTASPASAPPDLAKQPTPVAQPAPAPAPVPAPAPAPGPALAPAPAPAAPARSCSTAHLVPAAAPAAALLSVAHALLCPANALAATLLPAAAARPPAAAQPLAADLDVLPIEEPMMPTDDVSDLKDVFDAINRLCETMRTSTYDEVAEDSPEDDNVDEVVDTMSSNVVSVLETTSEVGIESEVAQVVECDAELVSPSEVSLRTIEAYRAERWSDALVSPPTDETDTFPSDTEPVNAACEPVSEMYYTASSEVSLLSDIEVPDRPPVEDEGATDAKDKEERKEVVIAGHVAAMRERFESMTRTNTPCPDLARSTSPSLDVFRNITPSPDLLG